MKILASLDDIPLNDKPIVLTIGNFDGVHLGHQAIVNKMKQLARSGAQKVLVTFENHPKTVLSPQETIPLICTLPHKLLLLEQYGFDDVILLRFSPDFAAQEPEEFLDALYSALPFQHLVLGYDAKIGKNKTGDRKRVIESLSQHKVAVHYLEPCKVDGEIVSSSAIRSSVRRGDFLKAQQYLGRPYSIYHQTGELSDLCLPPSGSYPVRVRENEIVWNGVAHLRDKQITLDNIAIPKTNVEIIFDGKQLQTHTQPAIQK